MVSLDRGKLIVRGEKEILIPKEGRKALVEQEYPKESLLPIFPPATLLLSIVCDRGGKWHGQDADPSLNLSLGHRTTTQTNYWQSEKPCDNVGLTLAMSDW